MPHPHRILSGLPRISTPSSTKIPSVLPFSRAPSPSITLVQAGEYILSPLKRLFAPCKGQTVIVAAGANGPTFEGVTATFNGKTDGITVVVEELKGSSIPLKFTFIYRPDQGFASIHEVTKGRNKRIKAFYGRLWYGEYKVLPSIGIHDKPVGPEVTIDVAVVERFCAVPPLDFAIITGWQSIMRAIFPDAVDGDLLKLVHLSNAFNILEPSKPFKVGDKCTSEAQILSVANSDSGKTVSVVGKVLRDGVSIIEIKSSFLYRGRFADFENTFETIDEPDYVVELNNAADVGTKLIFRVQTELAYKNKSTFSGVNVSSTVYVRDQLKTLIPAATADYTNGVSFGNPATQDLQRCGIVQVLPVLCESPYTLTISSVPSSRFVEAVAAEDKPSRAIFIQQNGRFDIIANGLGHIAPSWDRFTEDERLVGDAAKHAFHSNPENTVFDAKRLIGRNYDDGDSGKPNIQVKHKHKLKTFEISARVLSGMKETAEVYLGKKVTHAVVTVPASPGTTKDASTIAGLDIFRIVNEPTATAIAYGLDKKGSKSCIVVYDLGGVTFDVSLLSSDDGVFEVLATASDTHLGGEDFDNCVMDRFIKLYQTKTSTDVSSNQRALGKLKREAEKAKCTLCLQISIKLEIESFENGNDFSETLTRGKFEEVNMDLFRKTLKPVEQVLKDAGVTKSKVNGIVLVGGSTRIPKVQQLL
ncbi:HSP70-domain-containing protein [Clavulina sp. PMI_390]|nr:HSP70-domain-containing protein [Clavulina sp. PMI_390]